MSLRHQLHTGVLATLRKYTKPLGRFVSSIAATPFPTHLRPYQEACLQTCITALSSPNVSRIGVSLPTGAGKTTVFVSLISSLKPPSASPEAKQALIIVNSVELARQAATQAQNMFPEGTVEIDQGTKNKASGTADVTVATYQTLLRKERLEKYNPAKMKVVVVDEAHHAAAPSYRHILSRFHTGVRNPDVDIHPPELKHDVPIVGFSATFSRHDGLALGAVFQEIVYHQDFLSMIRERWLCNVRFTTVKATIDLSGVTVNSRTGEFNATSLAHVVNTDSVNDLVMRAWLDRASSRRSTLIFCVNIAHLRSLTYKFREAGIDARYVHAGTSASERKTLISGFRDGAYPMLLNVGILTEGADIPNIDCVIIAKPTRSRNMFAQMIGRGMRLSPSTGKVDCHIIDIVDSTRRVNGVVSTPTLFGLDPDEAVDDDTPDSLEERAESLSEISRQGGVSASVPSPTFITYIDYDDPFALVHNASGAPHIARMSPLAWVGCGGDVYVLECLGKGYVRIEASEDDETTYYTAHYAEAADDKMASSSPYCRPRKILTSENLEDAVRGSDKYIVSKVFHGRTPTALHRAAKWRKDFATKGQVDYLTKKITTKRSEDGRGPNNSFDLTEISKGAAANIITRLKHGARARYVRKVNDDAKMKREVEAEQRRQERVQVTVGPLLALN